MLKNKKNSLIEEIQSSINFPKDIKLELLENYLMILPGRLNDSNSLYSNKLIDHFKESISIINEKIPIVEKYINELRLKAGSIFHEKNPNFDTTYIKKDIIIKTKIIHKRIMKLKTKVECSDLEFAENQLKNLYSLLNFLNWLINNPYPILLNIDRVMLKVGAKSFQTNPILFKELHTLKEFYRQQLSYLYHIPPPFRSSLENRNFVRSLVDSGMASRKANTSYFESLSMEEILFKFFDSNSSPLFKSNLIPIKIQKNQQSVIKWINDSANIISKFDGINIPERKEVLIIFLTRYFFDRTYPLFQPINNLNNNFSNLKQKFLLKNPKEANIPLKYIPKNCINLSVSNIFLNSSISQAPVQWLKLMQFKVCPLDVAYCIFKTHESLSIMATLQATENSKGESSEDFFSKMPGFDDIFDLWITLVCVTDIADPRGMNDFIGEWTKLPGFPQRFLACCAYLEAAISQIETME